MPVDPTLDACKAAVAAIEPKAKPKVANPLAAIKVWLKHVQEDLAKIKATRREVTRRDGSLADIQAVRLHRVCDIHARTNPNLC